ncbi:zinc finger protein 185 isoform X4 [Haplochromis burtoni]|uniref:zinc finger protein 185 isoform X4 n=1 Tax=Haplochromis burtoni TaxID=8153 RepID=UPI001C2DEAC2|nr:zinc finger protein 185 isoform X4 [Haplochromis burtoni]
MSKEGDRASVLRTTKVRTRLRGDASWLQRSNDSKDETQEEKPWIAEVKASRLSGAPADTSPVSSPTNSTPPPTKYDTERQPTSGYLIRGVFTKVDKPPPSSPSNGFSKTPQFNKKPSETYKKIAPHTVRSAAEKQEGQLSLEELEKRTEKASNVLTKSAARQRSYVLSAAKKYESQETPDTSLSNSSPAFVATRVEITDDDEPSETPAPASAVLPSPVVPVTSVASKPAPEPQKIADTSTKTAAAVSVNEPVAPKLEKKATPEPAKEETPQVSVTQEQPTFDTKVAAPLPELIKDCLQVASKEPQPKESGQTNTPLVDLSPPSKPPISSNQKSPESTTAASPVPTSTVTKSPAPVSPDVTSTPEKSDVKVSPVPTSTVPISTVTKSPAPVSPDVTSTPEKLDVKVSPVPTSTVPTSTVTKSPAPVSPDVTATPEKLDVKVSPVPTSTVPTSTVTKSPAPVSPDVASTPEKSDVKVSSVPTSTVIKSPVPVPAVTESGLNTKPEPKMEPEPQTKLPPKPSSAADTLHALSNTLISFDTSSSSFKNDEEALANQKGDSADDHPTENSAEQKPDSELNNCEPITDDLLGFSDGPEEPAEPVPPSPGRWSQDLLGGMDSKPNPVKTSGTLDLLANDVIVRGTEAHSLSMQREEEKQTDKTAKETQSEEDNADPWSSRVTTVTTVVTKSSSADPFDPYPIGTTSPNSSSDLRQPLSDSSINSMGSNALRSLADDIIPFNTDKTSTQRSWETSTVQESNTEESQEAQPEAEGQAEDQQTVIMFERKSLENDSPWDRWTSPTVYTIPTEEEEEEEDDDDEEEEEKQEEEQGRYLRTEDTQTVTTITTIREIRSEPEPSMDRFDTYSRTIREEEQRVKTPEPETKKPFVFVKEYVNATETSLQNPRDTLNSRSDYLTSSSTSYSYSSPSLYSSYSRIPPSSTCTYCGEQVGNDAKITIEHLNINCHPSCFKCDMCKKPMGDLLHSMFLHGGKVHCETCYRAI